jgi:hypothetical protein
MSKRKKIWAQLPGGYAYLYPLNELSGHHTRPQLNLMRLQKSCLPTASWIFCLPLAYRREGERGIGRVPLMDITTGLGSLGYTIMTSFASLDSSLQK